MRAIWLFIIILNAYAGWLLTIPLRYIYHWARQQPVVKMLITVVVSSYIIALMWAVVKNLNYWEIYKHGYRPDEWYMYFANTINSLMMVVCWTVLYFGIKNFQMLQREKQNALKATTMAHQAHIKMLRYQLNPHFLFNTLNAISTLILMKNNETAEKIDGSLYRRTPNTARPCHQIPPSRHQAAQRHSIPLPFCSLDPLRYAASAFMARGCSI